MLLYISMIKWISNLAKLFFERLDHGNNFENRRSSELNLEIIIIILTLHCAAAVSGMMKYLSSYVAIILNY